MALSDGGSGSRREEAANIAKVEHYEHTAQTERAKTSKKEAKLREAESSRQVVGLQLKVKVLSQKLAGAVDEPTVCASLGRTKTGSGAVEPFS